MDQGQVALEHHWGLWYDRRRDDHQMVRRLDGDVWPPFYEQPWARSGQGRAWDGLSKYDLARFNPWYFRRLQQFAEHCDRQGLLLMQQMYFQHNVLEAGAHWADFPWRPANCLQETGFPEPPPYQGNKRVFMAEAFYDVSHPLRRSLHEAYIRHCLDTLGDHRNVLFFTGEEFTGPLSFMQFWLDTIAAWQRDTGKRVLVGLSCTKEVQDAILADEPRRSLIALIDLKYWWPTSDGGLFDPPGGQSLAPRQQVREWRGNKARSDEQTARAIREYRTRFPRQAMLCSVPVNPWAAVSAGASLVNLPASTDPHLLAALPRMSPLALEGLQRDQWCLSQAERAWFVYSASDHGVRLKLPAAMQHFAADWIDPQTGRAAAAALPRRDGEFSQFTPPQPGRSLLWVRAAPAR